MKFIELSGVLPVGNFMPVGHFVSVD